ncbi:transcriptional regulator [Paracoccus sp. P2]|uniref:transcriptional regulator n=1 Tax=Paracoccus sp. P2 TaxID=3248840 RepID=UPI00391FA2E8
MGKKETEEAIADSRAGRVSRVGSVDELLADLNAADDSAARHTMAELLAASDYSQPQPPEEREWVDAPAVGRELTPFDPAEALTTAEAISAFLAEAEAVGDPAYVEHAREIAARARAMHGLEG